MNRNGFFEGKWISDNPKDAALMAGLNAMVAAINQNRPDNGPGTFVTRGVRGTSTRAKEPGLPLPAVAATYPYQGTDASDTSSGKVKVGYGTHNSQSPQIGGVDLVPPYGTAIPVLTLDNAARIVYVEFDFTFDSSGNITSYTGKTISSSDSTSPPDSTVTVASDGSGSGSYYQTLFAVTVTPPAIEGGKYAVAIVQNVFASQTFNVCGATVQAGVTV